MIVEWVVSFLIGVVYNAWDAVLPSTAPPVTAIGTVIHGYTWLNTFLPVYEALDAARTVLEVIGVVIGIRVVMWALQQVPILGLGGRS